MDKEEGNKWEEVEGQELLLVLMERGEKDKGGEGREGGRGEGEKVYPFSISFFGIGRRRKTLDGRKFDQRP